MVVLTSFQNERSRVQVLGAKDPLYLIIPASWPNGKAFVSGAKDCRFESCVGRSFFFSFFFFPFSSSFFSFFSLDPLSAFRLSIKNEKMLG